MLTRGITRVFLLFILQLVPPIQAAETGVAEKTMPPVTEHYVMLYYRDIGPARDFYARILDLDTTFEDEWVTLYRLTPSSFIGVVQEGGSAYHRAQDENAVMVSLLTEDVSAWYERLSQAGVKILKDIYDHQTVPIRAFLAEDPGGYTIEFFQWLKRTPQATSSEEM